MLPIRCRRGVAVVLLLQALASASGFMPPPKNSPSIKTSDLSKSGLGGFDLIAKTNKKFIEGSTSPSPPPKAGVVVAKKVPIKKVVATSPPPKKALAAAPQKKVAVVSQKKVAIVAKGGTKAKVTTLGMDGGKVAPTETPWSTILVSFLIPWRNPNSIFLYMFLIITVLGKMKEHNQ
jgi:hypothetical protein